MKIPKKIKVGPYNYNVIVADEVYSHDGKKCYGLAVYDKQEIVVGGDIPHEKQQVVLMHETLHTLFELAGLPKKNEEEIVMSLSPLLVQLLKDNKKLVEYLLV